MLRDDCRPSEPVAGFACITFQSAMTAGRFTGDRVADRCGRATVARGSGLPIAVAMVCALPPPRLPQ
ncbi:MULTISPECIES: hypothetical protein [Streptomyces]|uniref:Uncharacterized protein n=1 Tax=Streptomyces canarius TaxID=285453 RepID=A0ABQ3DC90_9ACTN|nr:hypothetical protein [Streptomyces canarius]GHA76351.1 hypothetical protein GCM10010345_92950 [Streptomyces canarius]